MKVNGVSIMGPLVRSLFLIVTIISCTVADHRDCIPLEQALASAQSSLTTAQNAEATALTARNNALQANLTALAALTAAIIALAACIGGPLACFLAAAAVVTAQSAQDDTEQAYNAAQSAYVQAQLNTQVAQTRVRVAQQRLDSCRAANPSPDAVSLLKDSLNYYNLKKSILADNLKNLADLKKSRELHKKGLEDLLIAEKRIHQDPEQLKKIEEMRSKSQDRIESTNQLYESEKEEYDKVVKKLDRLKDV